MDAIRPIAAGTAATAGTVGPAGTLHQVDLDSDWGPYRMLLRELPADQRRLTCAGSAADAVSYRVISLVEMDTRGIDSPSI